MKPLHALALIATLCLLAWLTGCQTAGVTLATKTQPAHLRLPVDAAFVRAHLTQNACDLEIHDLRSSPAILAQGRAGHDVINGVQGLVGTTGAAIATSGLGKVAR